MLSQSRILELTSFSLSLLSLCLLWVHSFHSLCCLEAGFPLLLKEESILQLYKLFLVLWIEASLSIHIYVSVQSCQDEWCGCVLRAVLCRVQESTYLHRVYLQYAALLVLLQLKINMVPLRVSCHSFFKYFFIFSSITVFIVKCFL